MRTAFVLCLMIALCPVACATYREDLNRGQRMYEENQYEHALALWRGLEDDADSLSGTDQARYAYLRGMTDYRLGFRADARHWLAIAKATDASHPGGMSGEWKGRMEQSLTDLNQEVYGGPEQFETSGSRAVEYGKAAPSDGEDTRPAPPSPAPPQVPPPDGRCRSNADCKTGEICDGKACSPL